MDKPKTVESVIKIVENELLALGEKYGKIPTGAKLNITVTERDTSFKVYLKFNSKYKLGMALEGSANDYWFTWLKSEQLYKLIIYVEDSYLYIKKQLN